MNKRLIISKDPTPDSHPDLVVESGPENKGVGQWVLDKYTYLCTYIDAARGAAANFPSIVYIDPFCGPGRVQIRNESFTRPNGAVYAWQQSKLSGKPFTKILIGDIDKNRVDACCARLKAVGGTGKGYYGPANETVLKMVNDVPAGSLCLVYIDPYNLSLLSFDILKTLSKLKYVDFVVHFSTMDLLRNVDAELDPERARFDDVSPGWRDRITGTNKKTLPVLFLDDWQSQVKGLGFKCSHVMPLITNDGNKALYRLVFYARHDLPLKLWGDVARNKNLDLFSS